MEIFPAAAPAWGENSGVGRSLQEGNDGTLTPHDARQDQDSDAVSHKSNITKYNADYSELNKVNDAVLTIDSKLGLYGIQKFKF